MHIGKWVSTMGTVFIIVVAAGLGTRTGFDVPKQYVKMPNGISMLENTVNVFSDIDEITGILPVIHMDHLATYADLQISDPKILDAAVGGASRAESVFNGLKAISHLKPEYILVHDAARPFVTRNLVKNIISALQTQDADGIIPVISVMDTIHLTEGGILSRTLARNKLARAQTPQGFKYARLYKAYEDIQSLESMSDDASVAHHAGMRVCHIPGEETNIKMTVPQDFQTMQRTVRIGQGFDVHRFASEATTHVRLCGIDVPHTHGLSGHSDADVGLHALTDAILGAAAEGDIGQHFPPSDLQWQGVDSRFFLKKAFEIIQRKGGSIVNVDVTLICEQPKIAPFTLAMRTEIARLLLLDRTHVNVKGTTTEQLGFTGRREGIAAMATASIIL